MNKLTDTQTSNSELLLKLAQLMMPEKEFFFAADGSAAVYYKQSSSPGNIWFPWYMTDDAAAFRLMCEYKICVEYLCDPDAVIVSGFNHEVVYNSVEERRYATRKAIVLAVIKLLTQVNNRKLRLEKKNA